MKSKLLKILLITLFSFFAIESYAQIVKGTGITYTNGIPTHTPRVSTESEYSIDVSTGKGDLYLWNRSTNSWSLIGEGIDVVNNSAVPSIAPGYGQSRFRINNVPTLYFWTGTVWLPLTGSLYTAGTGIDITANVITNTGDLSNTNEIQYIDTLRLNGTTLEISLYNDGVPLKTVDLSTLGGSSENLYNINGTITDLTRVVSVPGNLVFSNNSASTGDKFIVSYDNGVSSTNTLTVQEGLGISLASSENNILLEGQTSFRDVLSPSALTGNTNNYTGLNGGNVGIFSSNGAYNITGIDGGINGRILFLFNSGSYDLTLKNQDGNSDVENRFYMGSDYVLKADTGTAIIMYDTLIPAWRLFKFTGGGNGTAVYQQVDTFEINSNVLSVSLSDDAVPASTVDLTPYLDNTDDQQLSIDSTITDNIERFTITLEDGGQVNLDVPQPNIDTFEINEDILSLSLSNDGLPASTVDLSSYSCKWESVKCAMPYYSDDPELAFKALAEHYALYDGEIVVDTTVVMTTNYNVAAGVRFIGEGNIQQDTLTTITFGSYIAAEPKQYVFTGTGEYAFDSKSTSALYPYWFGALGDGSNDDWYKTQKTINSALSAKIAKVKFLAGTHNISKGLLVRATSGTTTLTLEGIYNYDSDFATTIHCTDSTNFAIGIQSGRACVISNMYISGFNTSFSPATSDVISYTYQEWRDELGRNSRYSPFSGIVIDPFKNSAPSDGGYPGFSSQYSLTQGTTTHVDINNVVIRYFTVGIMISPSGVNGLGSEIKIDNVTINRCKTGVATGNTQSRSVDLINSKIAFVATGLNGITYGNQSAPIPRVIGGQFAFIKDILNAPASYGGGQFMGFYGESVYRIGSWTGLSGEVLNFTNCEIKLISNENSGTTTPASILDAVGSKIMFIGGSLYDANFAPIETNVRELFFKGTRLSRQVLNNSDGNSRESRIFYEGCQIDGYNLEHRFSSVNSIIVGKDFKRVYGNLHVPDQKISFYETGTNDKNTAIFENLNHAQTQRVLIQSSVSVVIDTVAMTATLTTSDTGKYRVGDILFSPTNLSTSTPQSTSKVSTFGIVTSISPTQVVCSRIPGGIVSGTYDIYLFTPRIFTGTYLGNITTGSKKLVVTSKQTGISPTLAEVWKKGTRVFARTNQSPTTGLYTGLWVDTVIVDTIFLSGVVGSTVTDLEFFSSDYKGTYYSEDNTYQTAITSNRTVGYQTGDEILFRNHAYRRKAIVTKGGFTPTVKFEFKTLFGIDADKPTPTIIDTGLTYFVTDSNFLKIWNGTDWVRVDNENIFNTSGVQDDIDRSYAMDSTQSLYMGQFTLITDLSYDGTDKGFVLDPSSEGVGLINGNGITGDYSYVFSYSDEVQAYARDGNSSTYTNSFLDLRPNIKRNRLDLISQGTTNLLGASRIWQVYNDTTNYIAIGHDISTGDTEQAAYFTIGYGGKGGTSFLNKHNKRAFAFQTYDVNLNPYLWLESRIPALRIDTTGNNLWMYNGSYGFKNARPTLTNGIMSFHYWKGNGTNTDPGFITMSVLADSLLNYSLLDTSIYSINGTVGTNRIASLTDNLTFVNNAANTGDRFVVTYDNGLSSTNFLQVKEGTGITLQSSENNIILEGQTLLADMVTPTALSSNTNDYTGLDGANFGRLSTSPSVNLTGFDNGYSGRILPIFNIDASTITLKDNVTSSSENRLQMPTDIVLQQDDGAFFIYDSVSTKWRLISTNIGSMYTGSGRMLNGRSADLLVSYMLDTLKDFRLGYFSSATADTKSTYGKFGLAMDGDGGFSVQGKETYIQGMRNDLLGKGWLSAGQGGYTMEGNSRQTVGGVGNTSLLYGESIYNTTNSQIVSENRWSITHAHDNYQALAFGARKQLFGVPQDIKDYLYMFQGGGETGGDTSAISVWVGIPQITDTVQGLGNRTRAKSKERGFGVQSLFETAGITSPLAYDWLKIRTGVTPSDTSNTAISLYGNSYYLPNDRPSTNGCDTCIWILRGDNPSESELIDLHDLLDAELGGGSGSGSTVNIYNSDGNLQNGGSQMLMDTIGETLRLVSNTGNTTTREMLRMSVVENAFTRFMVFTGPVDSARFFRASAGRQYTFQTYGGSAFQIASDSIISFLADSLLIVEGTVQTKTKVKFLLGMTSSNYVKRIDGDAASSGDIMISDGKDWTVGSLSANEANAPSIIYPSQLTAKTDNWNPSGYSTTLSQTIKIDGSDFWFITGMESATRNGVIKIITNDGTYCLGIAEQHTDSDSDNRFSSEIILYPGMSATFQYDSVAQKWDMISNTKSTAVYESAVEASLKDNTGTVTSADNPGFLFITNSGAINASSSTPGVTPRFVQLSTSTSSTSFPTISTKTGFIYCDDNGGSVTTYIRMKTRIRFEDLPVSGQDYSYRFGFEGNIDSTVSEGVTISFVRTENSGGFTLKTNDGSSPTTTTNCGSPVTADTWYTLDLRFYPHGEAVAFIGVGGTTTRYSTTSTVPDLLSMLGFSQMIKRSGSTARLSYTTGLDIYGVYGTEF